MQILGFQITRAKAAPSGLESPGRGGWWPIIREPFAGAWQRNLEERAETVLTYSAVYACVTLIASDIGKIRLRLVEQDADGIWTETTSTAFSPVLRKPNRYQIRIKFIEQWVVSKLLHGNAYILKERDNRGVVVAMYVLDPTRTKVLVAPDGSVYYQLSRDNLAGVEETTVAVPASEIIHDTMVPLYHPLCGVSPLTACGVAAVQGLAIQRNSTRFFQNNSRPGGILSAPGRIDPDNAARLKQMWEEGFSGENVGKVAVLGDDLKYQAMSVNPVDAQLIEQFKWSAETVCSAFHVPPYMIGVGAMPTYNNIEALNQQYYTQCLQSLIESIEALLDDGLGLLTTKEGKTYGTEFDLDDLLRMDTSTKVKTAVEGLKGIFTTDEARKKFDLKPTPGGNVVLSQQQNYSLAALAKRDAKEDPFGSAKAPAPAPEEPEKPDDDEVVDAEDDEERAVDWDVFRMIASGRTPLLALTHQPDASLPSP